MSVQRKYSLQFTAPIRALYVCELCKAAHFGAKQSAFDYMRVFVCVHALFFLQFVTSEANGVLVGAQIVISARPSW